MPPEKITKEKSSHDKSVVVQISTCNGHGLILEQRNDGWQFNFREGYGIYNLLEALSTEMQTGLTAKEKEKNLQEMNNAQKRSSGGFKSTLIRFSREEITGVEQTITSDGNYGHINHMKLRFANREIVSKTYKMLLPKKQ